MKYMRLLGIVAVAAWLGICGLRPGLTKASIADDATGNIVFLASVWSNSSGTVETPPPDTQEGERTLFLPMVANRYDATLATPLFGVQMYGNTDKTSLYYPSLIASKASWVRVPIVWSDVEPSNVSPDKFRWTGADAAIGVARDGGLNLIVTLDSAPGWAATYPSGPIDKVGYEELSEFVRAVIERYDGDGVDDAPGLPVINYWEFYNEPDLGQRYTDVRWGNAGAEYAKMLAAVYPVVKAANPNAQVVFGGIAYDWFVEDGGPFVRGFLDDVLKAGGGRYFDVMNFHSYPNFAPNWATQGAGLYEKAQFIQKKLHDEYGLEKPLVVTEAGMHSNDAPQLPMTPELQAQYVVRLFTQSMAANLQVMIWFMFYDPGSFYPFDNGLVTSDDPPQTKVAFNAYQTIVSELSTAHFERILTADETGATDMEAYRFRDNVKKQVVYVAWLNPDRTQETKPLKLPATQVLVRDIYGSMRAANDADDGVIDGMTTVEVSSQPVYIEVRQ